VNTNTFDVEKYKYIQPAPSNVFLNGVRVQILD